MNLTTTGRDAARNARNGASQTAWIQGLEPLESRTLFSTDLFIHAGQSIQDAINSAHAGDTIHVSSGDYWGDLTFNKSGGEGAPITLTTDSADDVFIDGYVTGKAHHVVLDGITVRNVRNGAQNENAAIRTNDDWVLKNVTAEHNTGTGIGVFGGHVRLINPTASYNGTNGIGGANCWDVKIFGGSVYKNNVGVTNPPWAGTNGSKLVGGLWYLDPAWEGGGGKWFNTDHVDIENMKVFYNGGPGIWFDGYNANTTLLNNEVAGSKGLGADWQGMGISIEITHGDTHVVGNYLHDNSGAGVAIQESTNTEIADNTFINDGLELRAMNGRPLSLKHVKIKKNRFKNGNPFVSVGSIDGRNVAFADNIYSNDGERDHARRLGDDNGNVEDVTAPALPTIDELLSRKSRKQAEKHVKAEQKPKESKGKGGDDSGAGADKNLSKHAITSETTGRLVNVFAS